MYYGCGTKNDKICCFTSSGSFVSVDNSAENGTGTAQIHILGTLYVCRKVRTSE